MIIFKIKCIYLYGQHFISLWGLNKKQKNSKLKPVPGRVCVLGVVGFAWMSPGTFQHFFSFLFIFLSVLFSQYCNASLDITQASLSCSASAESNLVQSAAARRIRLSFFRLLWNVPSFFFFFSTSKIHKAAKLLTCVRGAARLLHSFMPHYAKLHIVYLKNTEHFSTIKKHVI